MPLERFSRSLPWLLQPGSRAVFPDARGVPSRETLLAVGGDLEPERLLVAYAMGLFPWYDESAPILWWSPHPRAILRSHQVHVSHSLDRLLRRGSFRLSLDEAFLEVVDGCSQRTEGTWILPEMRTAYERLNQLGYAHSFEVWLDGKLAGGLYGVHLGGLFAAESMFHVAPNASKVALVVAVRSLARIGVKLFDVQLPSPHLTRMGATTVSRTSYLKELQRVVKEKVDLGSLCLDWRNHSDERGLRGTQP